MRQAEEHLQDKFSTEEIFLLRVENKIDPQFNQVESRVNLTEQYRITGQNF